MSQLFIQKEIRNESNIFSLDTFCHEKPIDQSIMKNIFYSKDDIESNEENYIINKNLHFPHINDNSIQNIDFFESNNNVLDDISSFKILNNNLSKKTQAVSLSNYNEKIKKEKDIKRLNSNKISARKSRQKKKEYIKYLEEELVKLKNNPLNKKMDNINENDDKNTKFFNNIVLIEKQEKEIYKDGQKKKSKLMKEYIVLQKILLKEMLIRQINYFIPLKYQIFGKKYIKLISISPDDSISVIKGKINDNLNKIENYINVSKGKIKFLYKYSEIYKKLINYIDNFQELFNENF